MYEFRVSLLNSALKRVRSPSDLNTKDNSFQDLARRVWGSLENYLLGIFGGTKECTSAVLARFKGSASSRNDSLFTLPILLNKSAHFSTYKKQEQIQN